MPKGFTTTLLLPSGNSDYATIATILQSELKPLGITVKVETLDPNTDNDDLQARKYDMTFSLWTMDIPDPDELATFALDPTSGAKSFFTFYDNPTVVKAVHAAEVTTDARRGRRDYNTAQTQAAQDAFMAFLYYSPYPYVESSNVHGFYVTPLGNYHWRTSGSAVVNWLESRIVGNTATRPGRTILLPGGPPPRKARTRGPDDLRLPAPGPARRRPPWASRSSRSSWST